MKGWIARDKDNELYFFDQEPLRYGEVWNADFSASVMCLDGFLLSHSIGWGDEPVKVEITMEEVAE